MPPLLAAALVVLLEALTFGMTLPVTSYYTKALGGDEFWIGIMFALVSAPKILVNPIFGRWSDRVGRRVVLAVNTIGTLAGSAGWAISGSLYGLAGARLVTGIFGAQAAIAQAVVADVAPASQRAAAVGVLGAAFGIAFTLGPLIGGVVGRHWGYASVGWVCAGMQLASLAVIMFGLRETLPSRRDARLDPPAGAPPVPAAAPSGTRPAMRLWQVVDVRRLLVVTLLMTLGYSVLTATFGEVNDALYGFDAEKTGYAFGAFGLVGILVQGGGVRAFVSKYGEYVAVLLGLLLTAGGLFPLGSHLPMWAFWSCLVVLGVGVGLSTPAVTAMLSQSVNPYQQGALLGLSQAVTGAGRSIAYVAGGWALGRFGSGKLYGGAAVVTLLGLAVMATAWGQGVPTFLRRARPDSESPAAK